MFPQFHNIRMINTEHHFELMLQAPGNVFPHFFIGEPVLHDLKRPQLTGAYVFDLVDFGIHHAVYTLFDPVTKPAVTLAEAWLDRGDSCTLNKKTAPGQSNEQFVQIGIEFFAIQTFCSDKVF